jgi:KDO2-lipid IV(A) lauroyltransferase
MRRKILKSIIEYGLFISFLKIFRLFPRNLSKKLLISLFLFIGLRIGLRKKIVLEQLKASFPDKGFGEIKEIQRNVYRNLALTSWEMFIQDKNQNIEVRGWENIQDALSLKRGLIIISGHLGNWELAGRFLAQQKLPLNVVIKQLRNPFINDFINNTRNKEGIRIIYKKQALRPVLNALQNNEVVVMLVDQDAGKEGIRLPFMNNDASVFTGFARLAERFDTPMVLGVSLREAQGKNCFVFEKPLLPSGIKSKSDPKDYILKTVRHFNERLEYYIKEHPEQWFWVHRRWKKAGQGKDAPEGNPLSLSDNKDQ